MTVRGSVLATLAAVVGLIVAGVGGTTPREIPKGWWKGTIVLEERWDQTTEVGINRFSEKGSATLRIERNARTTAAYEFEYRQETRWLSGECRGKLEYLWTASVKKTAPISVSVSDGRPGAYFVVAPKLTPTIDGVRYTCETGTERYDAGSLSVLFDFTSKQGHAATSRRGSGSPDLPVFYGRHGEKPRPGGVNTSKVTWDLKLVAAGKPTGQVRVGTPVLTRLTPSAVRSVVEVTQGGTPIRADSARCTSRLPLPSEPSGYRTSEGEAQIRTGEVACPHVFNNTRFNGKTLEGTLAVTVGKTTITRRFSVRIGAGKSLSNAKGAVIAQR